MFGSEGLYVYDFNGKLLWQKDLGTLDGNFYIVPAAQWGYASSPVLRDGKIIVQADVAKDSFLAAFDAKTGKELWRTSRADVPTFGTPAVVPYTGAGGSKLQVVVNGWKQIAGYDFETGKELWTKKGGGDIPVPSPVFADGLVVITHAHGAGRPVYAFRTDGELAWTQERAGNYMQTPLLHHGLAYLCFDNGVLTVFELATGTRVYQQRLGSGNSGYSSSPVAAGDNLYVTSEEGKTHVVALGREYKLVSENEIGETVMATPAVVDGVIYLRGRNHLFAIAAKK
jgi:outer membrane protein assembly factor BamB